MYAFIIVLIILVSLLLVGIVLVQNSKGGGLASSFSSSNQIMGAPKTASFLEKATWCLAGALLFLSIISSAFIPRNSQGEQSEVKVELPTAAPGFETTAPADVQQAAPAPEAPAADAAPAQEEAPAQDNQ
jgi:preprotein translocase subunit SecG